jgi:peptide/nickel transport system permease protein
MSVDEPRDGIPALEPIDPIDLISGGTVADEQRLDDALRVPAVGIDRASERRQARKERLRLLLRSPGFIGGVVVLTFWVLCAVLGDAITPFDPVLDRQAARQGPDGSHWFGTDTIGRDVLSRVMVGSRSVLVSAPIAAVLSIVAGTFFGLVMGYYRGWVDEILSRITEALLSIPVVLLALLTLTVLGNSRTVLILTVASLFTPIVTRTVRSAVMAEAQLDYVTSAKLRGESGLFVMTREIFPNITSSIVVELTVRVGYAIFTVATLAFFGFPAVQPPTPDWGVDIRDTYGLIQAGQWWSAMFPAIAIASLVIAVNLIADSIEKVANA